LEEVAKNLSRYDEAHVYLSPDVVDDLFSSAGTSAQRVAGFTVDLGTLWNTNSASSSGRGEALILTYEATVLSDSAISSQDKREELTAEFEMQTDVLTYDIGTPGLPVPVAQGRLSITSSMSSFITGVARLDAFAVYPLAVAGVDAGDTIQYNFTLAHHPSSNSAAYTLAILDGGLPSGMYEISSVRANGVELSVIQAGSSQRLQAINNRVLTIPGPLEIGNVLAIEYTIRLTTAVEAGSGFGTRFVVSPMLSANFGSHPLATVATVDNVRATTSVSVGIREPAVGVGIDTGPTSPGGLDAAAGQKFNVSIAVAIPEGKLDLAILSVQLNAGPARVVDMFVISSSDNVISSCGEWNDISDSLLISPAGHQAVLNLCNITNLDLDNQGPASPGGNATVEILRVVVLVEVDTLTGLLPG